MSLLKLKSLEPGRIQLRTDFKMSQRTRFVKARVPLDRKQHWFSINICFPTSSRTPTQLQSPGLPSLRPPRLSPTSVQILFTRSTMANHRLPGDGGHPSWTPINQPQRRELQHQDAFRIVQHLASKSLPRWALSTFQLVVPDTPIHLGILQPYSWSTAEIIEWWKTFMLGLLNDYMQRMGEQTMNVDDYDYLNGADHHELSRSLSPAPGISTAGNGPTPPLPDQ
ncbi:hypothetical protein EV426DRAFT_584428 [Tirmania nivea]|nr:hypothetical protein EV426DRAFT_584428 [Tirmania nivea]